MEQISQNFPIKKNLLPAARSGIQGNELRSFAKELSHYQKKVRQEARAQAAQILIRRRRHLKFTKQTARQRLKQILQMNAVELYKTTVESAYEECLELALSVTEKIIKQEISGAGSHYIENSLRSAINQLKLEARDRFLELNPEDYSREMQALDSICKEHKLSVKTMAELSPGEIAIREKGGAFYLSWAEELVQLSEKIYRNFHRKLEQP